MKKLFIGIDISKDVFDFCIIDNDAKVLSSKEVRPNTKEGINEFCKFISKYADHDIWICMEHTGHYGYLLTTELTKKNIKLSLINPLEIKNSVGLTRGKNDAVDAYRIANYALANKHKIKAYVLPEKDLLKLKTLVSSRDGYIKIVVQLKNMLKALEIKNKSIAIKSIINEHMALIKRHEKSINKIEKQMNEIIKSNQDLKNSFNLINSVVGAGSLTAIKCIVETSNFLTFTDPRKFSCHIGLAPFEYKSGSSIRGRTKTSPLSNKSLKAIMFKAAATAIQHDPQLKQYYKRKVEEGKNKLSVLNAVANKLILRIFAVIKRNEPYVKLAH